MRDSDLEHLGGTIALVGAGEYLPPMEDVDRGLLARVDEPRVVCLPTAAGTEGTERLAYWANLGMTHFQQLGVPVSSLDVIDRATAHDEAHAAQVREANFVYLSGGKPAYLVETLTGTPVWEAILDVLARGGVVAGCSAGAMIFGAKVPRLPPPPIWVESFGILPDAVIVPHFDEMGGMLAQLMHWVLGSGYTMLGIDGNTALVCANSNYTVAGRGGVTVWSAHKKVRYVDGDAVVWP